MQKYNFQYCQKIVVFSTDETSVLLCKRKGEADYDGVFSFIGGKMETTDASILDGLRREKNEEVGEEFKVRVFPSLTTNISFIKKDGSAMILPHIYAIHIGGDIELSEEYSEYAWVTLDEIDTFEPKIDTIVGVLKTLAILKRVIQETKSEVI